VLTNVKKERKDNFQNYIRWKHMLSKL
jgi:hypothetical protein